MKKLLIKQALLISLILIGGFAYSQKSVDLKYKFNKGKSYVQNTQISQNVTQTMNGQEMKVLAEVNSISEYNIENVEKDGNATILVSAKDLSVHSSMGAMDTTMKFSDLKDKFRGVYSITGKSISSTKVDSSEAARMFSQLDFGKLKVLPGKSIKPGEKWQDKIVDSKKSSDNNPFATETTSDMEYTLVGKEAKDGNEYFKISYTGTMTVNGKGNQMGMDMFIEGTGKTQGFMYFDAKKSMVVYSEDNTEMDMSVAVSGQQNMTIPMTQSIKTIITMEEKK
jgi:hypothetical protein